MYETVQRNRAKVVATLLAIGVCLLFQGVTVAGGGCTSAVVHEPFLLPDGSQHPGGQLTLCTHMKYSPVSHLHKSHVDGMPVSMLQSRHTTSEGPGASGAFMMFNRGSDGMLYLVGYANPGRDRMDIYTLTQPVRRNTENLHRMAFGPDVAGVDLIRVAARVH
jgi:hypothetical protein